MFDVAGEALAEVALYGADANTKPLGKLVLVKADTLVQEAREMGLPLLLVLLALGNLTFLLYDLLLKRLTLLYRIKRKK